MSFTPFVESDQPTMQNFNQKFLSAIEESNQYTDQKKSLLYATCSTDASTAAKVADCSGFVLATGASVAVKFTENNSASAPITLNVNNTGSIVITKYGNTAMGAYMWEAGSVMEFVYDGANWIMVHGTQATTTYYGVTKLSSSVNSTSTILAATPSAVKQAYDLANSAVQQIGDVASALDAINGEVA